MERRIARFVRSFVPAYAARIGARTGYRAPRVGFASARDPLFDKIIKRQPGHLRPQDLLDGAVSVVCYFIPFAPEVVKSNYDGDRCSIEWVYAYTETNALIEELNRALETELSAFGVRCRGIAPTHDFDRAALTSRWSHRHAAYVAGLGTFGVHNLLITELGCCGRLGSMIVDRQLAPTKRPSFEYCLFYRNESCLRCVERCGFEALGLQDGAVSGEKRFFFDRHRCYEVCLENAAAYRDMGIADICGKCSVKVPCATVNPVYEE
ncbi:MAG: epoxyqueuosine reductase [Spirochaetes bacterium]|nr:epoxyqueuosine reductase [Spirochaetota bacterium]